MEERGHEAYQELTRRSLATMQETVALPAVEPDRKRLDLPEMLPLSELKGRRPDLTAADVEGEGPTWRVMAAAGPQRRIQRAILSTTSASMPLKP